ncbi:MULTISPECIES: class I SAM-dependent DNA methyltransferase [Streptomycetaceae]|uniref:Methyltransferase n=1 Tax=Streptantibioticus cattleyicolor (strain ATCC 35852 / DSM 46488 / JCM 4925 / NBRC 14057 / NRRL 8057) TaxID=1003195 RepID=F8K2H2_STREN|nr:class I SAM-dependent methyltransferase [Streptantibioticus cattleyicolor]AEW96265.1 methyltransferase [Streptantibioticus cattleyicolor NRRL 8057 = DSM 46488]MYS60783.1 methyltransferase domain-containing protein [Streptomyces sp. SID5468]CCB76604.1 putative methyltransferase [Streptantibioticus cattleyicolor NRRL 8057 = DSM 46488]
MTTGRYDETGVPRTEDRRRDRTGQAEAFDAIGDRYDEAFPHKEGQLAAGRWLIESLPAGARVLDLGCGTGLPTAGQLAAAGLDVTGVDLSAGMVELARRQVPQATFHRLDIADLAPGAAGAAALGGTGRYDAVAAFFSLLMLPRAEITEALTAIHDLLVPGGLLALSMVEADVDDVVIPFLGNAIRVSGYLRDDLRRVVRGAGFEIVEETSYAYAPASTDVPPEEQLFLNCRRLA